MLFTHATETNIKELEITTLEHLSAKQHSGVKFWVFYVQTSCPSFVKKMKKMWGFIGQVINSYGVIHVKIEY